MSNEQKLTALVVGRQFQARELLLGAARLFWIDDMDMPPIVKRLSFGVHIDK